MAVTTVLSNGGASIFESAETDRLIVGTVDGVFVLEREGKAWREAGRALEGASVSALAQLPSGTLLAATHGLGVARSTDGGATWDWSNRGLPQFDLWSVRGGVIGGEEVALVGSMPAHLMISRDDGLSWTELPALREVESFPLWFFPPPPRLGHVKDIVIDRGRLFVGIEVGALLVSDDGGRSFRDLKVDPDPVECDMHRLLIDPRDPERMISAVGLVGLVRTENGGGHWTRDPSLTEMEYPDPLVQHPGRPDLLFMAVGTGWPPTWYRKRRAQGKIARSTDRGRTWERLLGGLPDGQRALFSALSINTRADGFDLFTADTDGQVFESRDGGDRWTMIAETAPVSKGEFYRALAKGRPRIAGVDDIKADAAATARMAAADAAIA